MLKQFLSKLIMLAIAAACLLSPAALLAMPLEPAQSSDSETELVQSGDLFPMYSSYNFPNGVPSNCPFPQRFRAGTRTIYSYAPVEFTGNGQAAVLWYELDSQGNFVSDDPFAATTFNVSTGEVLPFGRISFNQNVSGNVGVFLLTDSGGGLVLEAWGAYRIASSGESAPEPGTCPL